MALLESAVQSYSRFSRLFEKIEEAPAPDNLSVQLLKDWGFSSSNDRAFIPFLKGIGFLTPDGRPTERYHEYRAGTNKRKVLGQALRSAYSDLFSIKSSISRSDYDIVKGKFKSAGNTNDLTADRRANTFFAVLDLADITANPDAHAVEPSRTVGKEDRKDRDIGALDVGQKRRHSTSLNYNIQIHLPATKDVEVYNAIFKSLREHLLDE